MNKKQFGLSSSVLTQAPCWFCNVGKGIFFLLGSWKIVPVTKWKRLHLNEKLFFAKFLDVLQSKLVFLLENLCFSRKRDTRSVSLLVRDSFFLVVRNIWLLFMYSFCSCQWYNYVDFVFFPLSQVSCPRKRHILVFLAQTQTRSAWSWVECTVKPRGCQASTYNI